MNSNLLLSDGNPSTLLCFISTFFRNFSISHYNFTDFNNATPSLERISFVSSSLDIPGHFKTKAFISNPNKQENTYQSSISTIFLDSKQFQVKKIIVLEKIGLARGRRFVNTVLIAFLLHIQDEKYHI